MKHTFILYITAVALAMSLTGCSEGYGGSTGGGPPGSGNPYPSTQLPNNFSPVTTDGVTVGTLGSGVRGTALWSPSGLNFAFAVDEQNGTAVLGTTAALHVQHVNLGSGRTIVSLTDKYAVVTSWGTHHDWLYPIKGTSLGQPIAWSAPTDTWQEWVDTANGPAIVTGGYKPDSVALTLANGSAIQLHGGQVYPSLDQKLGAVVTGVRMKRVVHPVGDVEVPSEYQPSSAADPITLWDFASIGAPHQITTFHLPTVHLSKAAGQGELQAVVFSPNDKYVAVLVQGEYGTGAQLVGSTFIFATNSGQLVGTAPSGNGMQWSSDSKSLWLGPAMPEGQGEDRVVDIHGHTTWSWPDAMNRNVVMPLSAKNLLVVDHKQLAVWNQETGLKAFKGIANLQGGAIASPAPNGTKALLDLWGPEVYATW